MDKGYNAHGPSEKCEMIRKDECTFEACNEKYNGLRKCVGGKLALYVYKVYEKRKRIYKRAPTCKGSGDICNIVYLRFILNKILFINTCEAEKGRETEKRTANA